MIVLKDLREIVGHGEIEIIPYEYHQAPSKQCAGIDFGDERTILEAIGDLLDLVIDFWYDEEERVKLTRDFADLLRTAQVDGTVIFFPDMDWSEE